MRYQILVGNLSLINQHYNTMSSPDNSKIFSFNLYVKYDIRWKVHMQDLISNNSINDKIFWLAIVFECIFVFLFSHHRNIRLFYFWNTDV